jgi:transmembrane sensor
MRNPVPMDISKCGLSFHNNQIKFRNKLKSDSIKLFEKYLSELTNESENDLIESFFINGEDNQELRKLIEAEWNKTDESKFNNSKKLRRLLDKIHHTIRIREFDRGNTLFHKILNIYMKAAAILVIPLIIASVIINNNTSNRKFITLKNEKGIPAIESVSNTVYAPFGSRVSFILPDSTRGMLNSGSKLSYSIPFTTNRKIELEGEAWFDVTHDHTHPFEIDAGNSTVKVLGTSFNISAYPAEKYIEIVLSRGKVEFNADKDKTPTSIYQSERLLYENGNITKSVTDPGKYISWTEGKLVFRGDQMLEVARRIERWYNVRVELADKELEKYSFRGTFVDDPLADVLKLLSMTSPITYKITPRRLMSDGTYQKEKITIYLKK